MHQKATGCAQMFQVTRQLWLFELLKNGNIDDLKKFLGVDC
jgi:hypothetical protein